MKQKKRLSAVLAVILSGAMVLTLLLGLLPTAADAASSGEIRKQINALKKQRTDIQKDIDEVQKQYQANEDEIADMVSRKNVIDQQINLLHAEIRNINDQISAFNVMIADKQDELDHAEDAFHQLEEQNRARIRTMEEEGEISYWEVVFKANSLSDLLDRLNMVEEIAAADQRHLAQLSHAAEVVDQTKDELLLQKGEAELIRKEQDAAQEELDAKRKEADDLIAELLSKGYELEDLEARSSQAKEDILDDIALKEKEYNEAKHQEWLAYMATYTTVPPTLAPPPPGVDVGHSGGAASSSGWLMPCSYRKLTSPFGNRKAPTAGASTFHKGVDLAAPAGTPIAASRTGVVTQSGSNGGLGICVTVNHGDGYSSIYGHMTNAIVSVGQAVSAGQTIGYMGSTGISTGNHLHFGIIHNGSYENPASYIPFY